MCICQREDAGRVHDGRGWRYLDPVLCTRGMAQVCRAGLTLPWLPDHFKGQNLPISETLNKIRARCLLKPAC